MSRILVVDDDKHNLKAVGRILKAGPHTLEFASSGEDALDKAPSFQPELVILDIMMPGMNGYEVCRLLKHRRPVEEPMVLLLSAMGTLRDRLQGYEVLADDYLCKPYEPEELNARIDILLRLKNSRDALREINHDLEAVVQAKSRELARKEFQAQVGLMTQGLVHNLKNLLMAARARAEMAMLDLNGPLKGETGQDRDLVPEQSSQKALRQLELCLAAIDRLNGFISGFLAKSREEVLPQTCAIDLNEIIRQELKFLEGESRVLRGVTTTLNLDPSLPSFPGAYSDFSQVFHNIVMNAMDALKSSSTKALVITTSCDREHLTIQFGNTGPAIAPEIRERIFDPFFSTKAGEGECASGCSGGTGLGLYTCREIIRSYGGSITARSIQRGGTGYTVFTVALPRIDCQQGPSAIAERRFAEQWAPVPGLAK